MEPLTLFVDTHWISPYALSAFVALEEKGLPYTVKELSLPRREHFAASYGAHTGRVPALQHGDFWLAESSAIDEYLEDAFPPPQHPRLYPADPKERARVRMVQALVRSDFMPIREERSTGTLFAGEGVKPLSAGAQAAAERLCRIAGSLVKPGGFVASHFTPADADLALILMRLVKNGDPVPAPLATWAREIFARPSVKAFLANTKW